MSNPARAAAEILARVRRRHPLVHHLANEVVANDTANVTLHLGAMPVMAVAAEEAAEMADHADALVLNLGMPRPARLEAMLRAGRRANGRGIPVILDPVGVGATTFRTEIAHRFLEEVEIAVIRGNEGEIGVLAGTGGEVRGVDGVSGGADPTASATTLALRASVVVASTGQRDIVTDGRAVLVVDNGHPLMRSIVGTGCMATTAVACFAAVEKDLLLASAAALAAFGLAGERAAVGAAGPGSFKVALFDALAGLESGDLAAGARLVRTEVA